ncbi:ankyrin, partial [Periconia macrospinosa]
MNSDQYALHDAAKAGNDSRIRALLKDAVDVNQKDKDGRTALHYAVLSSCTNLDANIQDNDGRTALHLAAQLNSFHCLCRLLERAPNIDANIQDNDGRTP